MKYILISGDHFFPSSVFITLYIATGKTYIGATLLGLLIKVDQEVT